MRFDLRRPTLSWDLLQFQQNFHQFPLYIYISVVLTSVSVFYNFLDSYRLKLKCPYTFQFSCFCSSKNETLQG